jgi:hypothetical protein
MASVESVDERRRGWISTVADAASVTVAIAALVVAFIAEGRSAERFERQLDREEALTVAQVRPLLDLYSQKYDGLKAVRLANRGLGPAIITDVQFCKEARCAAGLVELFSLPPNATWDTYRRFRRATLRQDAEVDLVKLSHAHLLASSSLRARIRRGTFRPVCLIRVAWWR